MPDTKYKGFNLIELIVVVLVVGILVAVGVPNYLNFKERTLGKEAKANLRLIQAAEKIYKMEQTFYYPDPPPETTVGNINSFLKLSLTSTNWTYSITSASTNTFNASATRPGCVYYITHTDDDATAQEGCP